MGELDPMFSSDRGNPSRSWQTFEDFADGIMSAGTATAHVGTTVDTRVMRTGGILAIGAIVWGAVLTWPSGATAGADECEAATLKYNSVAADMHDVIMRYATCISTSRG